jgi:hypothetical protein
MLGLLHLGSPGSVHSLPPSLPQKQVADLKVRLKDQCFEKIYVAETGWTEDNAMIEDVPDCAL